LYAAMRMEEMEMRMPTTTKGRISLQFERTVREAKIVTKEDARVV
jgi:hypothetical protein